MPTQTKPTTLSYKGDVVQIDQFGNYKKYTHFQVLKVPQVKPIMVKQQT